MVLVEDGSQVLDWRPNWSKRCRRLYELGGDGTQRARTAFGLFAAQRALCDVANGSIAGDTELWISNYISSKLSPADMPAATAMLQTMCSHPTPAALRKTYLGALASSDPLDDMIYAAGSSIDTCDSATATTDHPARLRANYCSHGVGGDPRALTVESVRTDARRAEGPDARRGRWEEHGLFRQLQVIV